MKIQKEYSLKSNNTFNVDIQTKLYAETSSVEDCIEILNRYPKEEILVLGDGSNTLFVKDWDGLIVKSLVKGIVETKDEEQFVYIESGSGENWDNFVRYCVKQSYA
jgi:UDP-N-acetylmuramate dehydrogenase